ncbi:MAG: DUF2341 domain-containing protein [Fibrobacter sp.]|nr:DUF2341 domain-containing protein [Fibrobacter sp.]
MRYPLLFSVLVCSVILCCSRSPVDLAGGSTSTPNEVVMGCVVLSDGAPAARTIVQLIPSSYSAIGNTPSSALKTDTTDNSGTYCFTQVDTGMYNIQAVQIETRTRALVTGIYVENDTIHAPSAVVEPPGRLLLVLSESFAPANGALFIPGTTVATVIDGTQDTLVLDSVPAGMLPGIFYAVADGSEHTVLWQNIPVSSGETITLSNPAWKFSRRLYLNTTMAAAAVAGNVPNFPVLIRLTTNNFDFSQAQSHGADIRFSKSDNTSLAHEIERWDSTNGKAEIWVKVDTVYGNDSTQYMLMYWGNPDAPDNSNSAMVFDTAAGFQGVWHMSQAGNTTAVDATANRLNGTPSGMNADASVEGMIGRAQYFNGTSSYIALTGSAYSKLDFPQNGNYTLSAWVYTEVIDGKAHYILSKSNNSYNLNLSTKNLWEIYDVEDGIGLQSVYAQPNLKQWTYLTGVCKGNDMRLYVDGICIDSTISIIKGVPHESDSDVHIGKRADSDYGYWNGMLDEVTLLNVSLGPDWIKLCYMNQRIDDKLVVFR